MNNPKDMMVSDEWIRDRFLYGPLLSTSEDGWNAGTKAVRTIYEAELTKLRSERDELVGALRATWNALEASPCDPDITVDQIAAHAEMNKHNVPELLAKHKPE